MSPVTTVLPGLLIGTAFAAKLKSTIADNGITHVVSLLDNPTAIHEGLEYLLISAKDNAQQQLFDKFVTTIQWIHEARASGAVVLVHCFAGKSRSATIVTVYLMAVGLLTWEQALALLCSKRPVADPNANFRMQIARFERTLRDELHTRLAAAGGLLDDCDDLLQAAEQAKRRQPQAFQVDFHTQQQPTL
eukprot:m.41088 g.41088  ORF g.41088 m.41088 type:complete len:190 (+) comp11426_c0_seq1:1246-1815(+)